MRMAATHHRLLALLGVLTFAGCCCCGGSGFQEAIEEAANQATSMLNVTQLTNAVVSYKSDNGEWPASLEDVRDKVTDFDKVMNNPLTKSNPGYEYVKPTETDPSYDTVIIYQLRDGSRDTTLVKGYANGTVGTSATSVGGTGASTDATDDNGDADATGGSGDETDSSDSSTSDEGSP